MSCPSHGHEQLLFPILTKHIKLMQRTSDGYEYSFLPTNSVIRENLQQKQMTIHIFIFFSSKILTFETSADWLQHQLHWVDHPTDKRQHPCTGPGPDWPLPFDLRSGWPLCLLSWCCLHSASLLCPKYRTIYSFIIQVGNTKTHKKWVVTNKQK